MSSPRVGPRGHVYRGADRSLLLAIESGISSPDVIVYDALTDTLSRSIDLRRLGIPTSASVSRDGMLIAISFSVPSALRFFDPSLNLVHEIELAPIGLFTFDSTSDRLFGVDGVSDELVIIETATFTEVSRQPFKVNFYFASTGTRSEKLAISNDGRCLAARGSREILLLFVGESLDIDIDIKPGSDPNSINLSSEGVIPAAILGSDTIDVANVDATTLAFGPSGAAPAHCHGPHVEDVNADGLLDLIAHFRTEETGIEFGSLMACLSGETLDGTPFNGCDAVRAVPDMGADKLFDMEEATFGTDALHKDTDRDGFTDGDEVFVMKTDPLNAHDPASVEKPKRRSRRRR